VTQDPTTILRRVGEADEQFQGLMSYLRGPEAQASTAGEVELRLFRSLLALGAKLLGLYFALRAAAEAAPQDEDGVPAAFHSWQSRIYSSVFGPVTVRRRYYRRPGGGGTCPLDERLSFSGRCYSDVLRDWLEFAVTNDAYAQATGLLKRILGVDVSTHALERLTEEDAQDVEAFYAQKAPPPPADEGSILVVQVDGKGVRMSQPTEDGAPRTEKKEAVVTAIYSIQPHRPHAEAIADTLAGKEVETAFVPPKQPRPEPRAKELRVTLEGKDAAFDQLVEAARKRDGPHIQHRAALTDGAVLLQQRVRDRLPDFTLILDLVHVSDYVRSGAEGLLGQRYEHLSDFVACRLLEILTGKLEVVLAIFENPVFLKPPTPAERAAVATAARYLRNNADLMHYDQYLATGLPIATGVIEGACVYLVKDRMERAGMKWRPPGAQAVLSLRTVRVNDDWDDYQHFRRQRHHLRRYGSTQAPQSIPEHGCLDLAA